MFLLLQEILECRSESEYFLDWIHLAPVPQLHDTMALSFAKHSELVLAELLRILSAQ